MLLSYIIIIMMSYNMIVNFFIFIKEKGRDSEKQSSKKQKKMKASYICTQEQTQVKTAHLNLLWESSDNLQAPTIIVDKATLALLVDVCSQRCKCGGVWETDWKRSYDCGHVLIMVLGCQKCGEEQIWESSKKYSDGTYEVNRKAVASWILVGGDGQHKYSAFFKQWQVGHVARSAYYRHQELFCEKVKEVVEEEFEKVIQEENERVIADTQIPGTILKMDTQYACQPKTGSQANNATTTFMVGETNKIVGQYNVSKQLLAEKGDRVK
jgi:hypothetical protein